MSIATETHTSPKLVTSRTPVGPTASGAAESIGGMAFNDSVLIIVAAWAIVFILVFTLRQHNV